MSTESSSKNASVAVFHIAINTSENIARALRRFLTSVKYANVKYGEAHYRNYLKGNKGHKFKSESAFAHVAYDVKKSDVERIPVSARDKEIIESMTHNMNIDYCLMRRPDDLEELVKKAVTDGNSLTDFEKKIVTAFTIRDENNQIVMNPESPDMPVINDAEYMLTICSIDLAKWEVITRELEVLSHRPSLMNRLKDAKLMNIVSRIFNKTKEHTQERETEFSYVQNQVQEQTNKNDYKDRVTVNPFVDEGTPEVVFDEPRDAVRKILYYFLPKVASYNDLKEVLKQLGFNIHDKYELNNVFKFTADESLKVERSDDIPALANYDVIWFRMPNTNGDQFIEIPNKYISWNEKAKEDGSTATIELPVNEKFKVRNSEQLFRPFYKDNSNKGMQTVEEFRNFWEDKTKQDVFTISLPDSDLEINFSSIDDMNGNPYTLESIESFIKDNERTDNAEIVYTILNTDAENLGELQDRVFKKANIHLEQQTDEMISEKPILETIPPDISMKRCLDFLVPKVKSYEDLKECLELIGFSIRDSMFNANTSVDDFMNNTKNMQFKVINMDSWKSTSNLKGFDGLDYSLQSILDRIEDNSRSESVSVVKDLLDCRSMDEIDVMVDRVLAMAHVKDDIPVEENKDVPDMEFINSLNTDQLNHYINHFAQDDKSLKYAKKRLEKMNISKQKTTSRENRKPTRVREDRTV
ncbi:hypothetical protein [Holdemanella porci]|uniref:hypothetical protein n=1 Tax=Holdemanella porci TaxID=2652276 RepID=UPI0022DF8958|nr:hypothetical protein [Holdemanella porci]